MNIWLLSDILGYIAVIFSILWFITTNRQKMLIFWIIATLLLWISVYSYGWYNGLAVSIISIIIKILSLYIDWKYLKYIKYSSPFIAILLFFLLPEWIEWIIPALSMFFIIIADSQKNVLYMKYWYYWSNLLRLSYWIILMCLPSILFDTLWFFAITYWIYKIKKNKRIKK